MQSLIKAFPSNSSTFKFDDHNALYAYSRPTFDTGTQYEPGNKNQPLETYYYETNCVTIQVLMKNALFLNQL